MAGIFYDDSPQQPQPVSTTVVNTPNPLTQEEKDLIALQTQLGQRQLANIDELAPLQKQLIEQALNQNKSQSAIYDLQSKAIQDALDYESKTRAAMSPEELAQIQRDSIAQGKEYLRLAQQGAMNDAQAAALQSEAIKAESARAAELAPIQKELLNIQLEQLRNGGAATETQKQQIADATNAALLAGNADIDVNTQRGLGLIADELANARGLRLTDSPMTAEAALLARAGTDQKASLQNNLRSAQTQATLNYPLAVQQLQSGINLNQQNINSAATNFQAQLRQQAYQNRIALTQPAIQSGLGLASIGGNTGAALSSLASARGGTQTTNGMAFAPSGDGLGLSGLGSLLQGGAAAYTAFAASDIRLKKDITPVGETGNGIGLYTFRYKGDKTLRIGPMAHEVERKYPNAVKVMASGYKAVDYGAIR